MIITCAQYLSQFENIGWQMGVHFLKGLLSSFDWPEQV